MHHELLSNYLPDEDDPEYAKFERGLPDYKRRLDEQYPQICADCAPKAQSMIHDADYYSMTNNASRLMVNSRGGRRSLSPVAVVGRDSWTKIAARTALTVVGWLVFLSAAYQVLWHGFAVAQLQQESVRDISDSHRLHPPVKASQCLEEVSRVYLSGDCCTLAGNLIPRLLLISFCCLWYNHGLKQLYSPNVRIASVNGWTSHLALTFFTLLVRIVAYSVRQAVRTPQLLVLSSRQEQAVHMAAIALIIVGHYLARQSISTEKWRVNGSMMPRPEDRNILGQFAGPAADKQAQRASRIAPSVLLSKENAAPFPIQNLTADYSARPSAHSDYGDPMDIEPVPPAQSLNISQKSDWNLVRTNIFSIEDEMRAKQERNRRTAFDDDKHMYFRPPRQATPFRGRLPQAPMSQERKLRNPVTQVPRFKEPSVTQSQGFLQQMRNGIDRGKGFAKRDRSTDSDRSEVTTGAASRTRGQLNLSESDWHLPTDVNATTGLEDQFGGTLKINDRAEPGQSQAATVHRLSLSPQQWYTAALVASIAVLLVLLLDVGGLRRGICLYFVRQLKTMGY
ncbi:hypothetical protein AMS68_002964 [Peltaster fructicola]|uniref:Ima1 N-terminal domain-containing protein n=1 Tax=Peltaster fructicola TaxID=286661 RepID=A0A6H0XRQ9_9PEZI|nr:hypothetical protein AMS68_002964 [Peltaster fructicola]